MAADTVGAGDEAAITAPAVLRARKASVWREPASGGGFSHWIVLEDDVRVQVGAFSFSATRAAIRVDVLQKPGRRIHQLWIDLENAKSGPNAPAMWASAPRLLVTVATTGPVELQADALTPDRSPSQTPFVQEAVERFARRQQAMMQPWRDLPTTWPSFTPEVAPPPEAAEASSMIQPPALPGDTTPPPEVAPKAAPEVAREVAPQAAEEAAPEAAPLPQPTVAPTTPPPATSTAQAPTTAPAGPVAAPIRNPLERAAVTDAQAGQILPASGTLSLSAQRIVFERADAEAGRLGYVGLIGDVRLMYQDPVSGRNMSLRAENAVVFLSDPAAAEHAANNLAASGVSGVYLEDNVIITDGRYTMRAPRVYYDLGRNKALILQAVLYAWDARKQIPLYIRAEELRQTAFREWEARRATLTTSEFAEPHLSIGASKLTLKPRPGSDGDVLDYAAHGTTLRWGRMPFFAWPKFGGQVGGAQVPLRRLGVGYNDNSGPVLRTGWDVFGLLGRPAPDGVDILTHIDYLGDHGPAFGFDGSYDLPRMLGQFQAYTTPYDQGDDDIGNRDTLSFSGEPRGFLHLQHRQYLPDDWELSLEGAYVSDPTFLEEFFKDQAYESKPYETSLYLKKQEDDWALTFLAGSSLNDFLAQPNLLQTPGYDVERMPELGWWQVGRSLGDDRLTYFGQTQASRLRVLTDETTPGERGFTPAQSMDLFGIPDTTRFEDAVLATGVPDDSILRLDSRHEVQAPMRWLIFDVTPYAAGRVTAYDNDFSGFSSEADYVRLWGSTGVRVGTEFSNAFESVNLPILDVHGVRHIFEPSTELFMTGSTVSPGSYPIYDPDVEGISDAWGMRLGGRNTLQTRRGGPGRWRTVDWIVLDNTLSLYANEPNPDVEVPISLGYRPEYGSDGDNLNSRLMWMVSDTFGLSGEQTYGLYDQEVEQWRVGLQIDHSPELSTHVDYVHIPDLDQSLLIYGLRYRLSAKYRILVEHTLDLEGSELSRQIDMGVERLLPRARLRVQASFNQIDEEQSVVILLIPEGISARGDRQWDTPAGGP